MRVTEIELVQKLTDFITVDADYEELAGISQEAFGGTFKVIEDEDTGEILFEITETETYLGAFGWEEAE